MYDHISDMLNRIKNGQKSGLKSVFLRSTMPDVCFKILNVMYKEGFINGFQKISSNNTQYIEVFLKYNLNGKGIINTITRISKPGRRVYTSISPLWKIKNGLGCFIISTPKGILTDSEARFLNVGGEILCSVA